MGSQSRTRLSEWTAVFVYVSPSLSHLPPLETVKFVLYSWCIFSVFCWVPSGWLSCGPWDWVRFSAFTCRETSDMPVARPPCPGRSWWPCCLDCKVCTSGASTSRRRSGSPWAGWGWRRPRKQEVDVEHRAWRYVPAPLTTQVTHVR